ncbi:hypothetical protein [Actinoplanes sp. NPDC049802]|uniref:hypothetical protein n=1 Tax=Actinoplanes sp. NPDC049802 TaxID=3154742 RepID=UPI0033D23BD0
MAEDGVAVEELDVAGGVCRGEVASRRTLSPVTMLVAPAVTAVVVAVAAGSPPTTNV